MLGSDCEAVLEAASLEQLRERALRAVQNLGFEMVTGTVVVDGPNGSPRFHTPIQVVPEGYLAMWNDRSRARLDPTSKHAKTSSLPVAWNRDYYARHDALDLWKDMAPFGYEEGVVHAFHMPNGRHFMFGVDCQSGRLPSDRERLARVLADVQLLGVHCQAACDRLARNERPEGALLSSREREALGWTLQGKTAWEASVIMSLSERTTNQYLGSAMKKLGCINKHQAAVRALELGLIQR